MTQTNTNQQQRCIWGALFHHVEDAHPLMWTLKSLGSSQGCVSSFFFHCSRKAHWIQVGAQSCQGPVSLTVRRVHSQCPHWRKSKQVEKELFPLEKHQGDYFCSLNCLRGEWAREAEGGLVFSLWAADCFTCQICNAFLQAGSWLNSGPRRSGRGSPKPGEFQTSCFGVPLARTGVVARHLQTAGPHLPMDGGQQADVTHLLLTTAFLCLTYFETRHITITQGSLSSMWPFFNSGDLLLDFELVFRVSRFQISWKKCSTLEIFQCIWPLSLLQMH